MYFLSHISLFLTLANGGRRGKTHAHGQNGSRWRKHLHQFDNKYTQNSQIHKQNVSGEFVFHVFFCFFFKSLHCFCFCTFLFLHRSCCLKGPLPPVLHMTVRLQVLVSTTACVKKKWKKKSVVALLHVVSWTASSDVTQWLSCWLTLLEKEHSTNNTNNNNNKDNNKKNTNTFKLSWRCVYCRAVLHFILVLPRCA